MTKYTKFTAVEAGEFKGNVTGKLNGTKCTVDDAAAAAGSAPTAAEFKKVVDLANDLKAKLNALIS